MSSGPKLRIDKWLWFARVVKTRSLAAKLVHTGHVRVNKVKVTTASFLLKTDDVLTIALNSRIRILKVVEIGARRGPASAAALLFDDLTPIPDKSAETEVASKTPSPERRPDKHERRKIGAFKQGFK